ncbi:MAG: hypothetical protein ACPLTR_10585 [Thermacetogeniaceae bacterium]
MGSGYAQGSCLKALPKEMAHKEYPAIIAISISSKKILPFDKKLASILQHILNGPLN